MQLHVADRTFSSVAERSCVKEVSRPTKMRSALMALLLSLEIRWLPRPKSDRESYRARQNKETK